MMRHCVIGVCVLAAGGGLARAGGVNLTGDYGTQSFIGTTVVGIGATDTIPFSRSVPGRGVIVGELVSVNTGGQNFRVAITNLHFDAANSTAPNQATSLQLIATQNFDAVAPSVHLASHSIDGIMGSDTIGGFVTINTLHELTTPLSQLTYSSPSGATAPFSVGPIFASVPQSGLVYSVRLQLNMTIFGNGFIDLPNSYETVARAVPGPGGLALVAAAGLLGARRRR